MIFNADKFWDKFCEIENKYRSNFEEEIEEIIMASLSDDDADREAAIQKLVEALEFAVDRYDKGYDLNEVFKKSTEALKAWRKAK